MQGSDRGRLRVQGHPPLSACVLPVTDGLPELPQACLWPADSTSPESSALCVLIGISLAGCPKPSDQGTEAHGSHSWSQGNCSAPFLITLGSHSILGQVRPAFCISGSPSGDKCFKITPKTLILTTFSVMKFGSLDSFEVSNSRLLLRSWEGGVHERDSGMCKALDGFL